MMFSGVVGGMLALIVLGIPIAFAIGIATMAGNFAFNATSLTRLAESQFSTLNSFVLLAIPFFILAGNVMLKGQMARYLFDFMNALSRWITGGAAIGAGVTCAIFGALTGSSAAAAAALSPVVVPELTRVGYNRGFACGLIAAGGTLGIMIPPSIVFIIYASFANVSVADLFLAGVVPGLFLAALICLAAYVMSRVRGYGQPTPFSLAEVFRTGVKAIPALLMPVIVLGGIYSGWFTPTEAAALSVAYSVLVAGVIYRSLQWRDLPGIFVASAKMTAVIMFILAASLAMGSLANFVGIPDAIVAWVNELHLSRWQFLLIVNVVLLGLGCLFDGVTLLVLVAPLLLPAARQLGVDPIHFCIMLTANIEIASITPPVGFNLFMISGTSRVSIHEVAVGAVPFLIVLLIGLFVVTYVPWLSLVLL